MSQKNANTGPGQANPGRPLLNTFLGHNRKVSRLAGRDPPFCPPGQGRGVAAPLDAIISLCAQRNEAKKRGRPPCPPLAGSLHYAALGSSKKNSPAAQTVPPRIPASLHSIPAASHAVGWTFLERNPKGLNMSKPIPPNEELSSIWQFQFSAYIVFFN